MIPLIIAGVALVAVAFVVVKSFTYIGADELGLVTKRLGRTLDGDNPIAFNGEAGYQADLLSTGLRFKLWPLYGVSRHDIVQIPAGEIGVVISQVGTDKPIGAKSAEYKPEFAGWDLRAFVEHGGQKGVQRPVLTPGTVTPIHPVGFLVVTRSTTYGVPISSDVRISNSQVMGGDLVVDRDQLRQVDVAPDTIGVVTTMEGPPLEGGDIASRLDGFDDIRAMEDQGEGDAMLVRAVLTTAHSKHDSYQDYQAFLDRGGHVGLQHDPLLPGAYLLNPFLLSVKMHPMTVIEQGEVAVVKSYVGLPTEDTSGETFKFGAIVRPGHQGVWKEPLRTGKYALNPYCYAVEIVPTSILTLNWAASNSEAHRLDAALSPIDAKSCEGFLFKIDLQVQIHVPDAKAPMVISMVGTMENLVNEVLQSAVGNYFRDHLQQLPAVKFIETRGEIQVEAQKFVAGYLQRYNVETPGVYIQDVVLPDDLVQVLQDREIANQQKATYVAQEEAQKARVALESTSGTADMQKELAQSDVSISIERNNASALREKASGEAEYTTKLGRAEADVITAKGTADGSAAKALGEGNAAGYQAQKAAVGPDATALIAVTQAIAEGNIALVPEVLVTGGGGDVEGNGGANAFTALTAMLTHGFQRDRKDTAGPDADTARGDIPTEPKAAATAPTTKQEPAPSLAPTNIGTRTTAKAAKAGDDLSSPGGDDAPDGKPWHGRYSQGW